MYIFACRASVPISVALSIFCLLYKEHLESITTLDFKKESVYKKIAPVEIKKLKKL